MSENVITRAELEWVLQRHGNYLNAAELVGEIEANRDSTQYEPGAAYQDPEGNLWIFSRALVDDSPHWLRPGLDDQFEYVTPRRPLTPLVPLARRALLPDERDLIMADLGRLLMLLGLGGHARPASPHEVFALCLDEVAKLTAKAA